MASSSAFTFLPAILLAGLVLAPNATVISAQEPQPINPIAPTASTVGGAVQGGQGGFPAFPPFPPFPSPPPFMPPPPFMMNGTNGCGWVMGFSGGPKGIECSYQNGYITENGVTRKATPEEQAKMEQQSREIAAQMHKFFQQMFRGGFPFGPGGGVPGPVIGGGPLGPAGPVGGPQPPVGIIGGSGSGEEETGPPLDLSTTSTTSSGQ